MASLTPAQQSGYLSFINSGKATPIDALATPDVTQPNFSTGGITTSAPTGSATIAPVATYAPSRLADPAKWSITSNQTVGGQLDNVLAKDSLPMQRARNEGLQLANSRGLLNSSMAVGAAQDSLIGAALPIAQADATANLGVNRYNVDTANTFATTNAAAQNAASSLNTQQINATNQFNVGNEVDKQAAAKANEYNVAAAVQLAKDKAAENAQLNTYKVTAANFEANVKVSLEQMKNDANYDLQTQQSVGTMANDFMKSMQQINQDTNMDQRSKDSSINQLFGAFKSSISLVSAVGSIPNVAELLVDTRQTAAAAAASTAAAAPAPAPAPDTYIPGQSNNPVWEQVLAEFNAEHRARFGTPMNRPWSSDDGSANAYQVLVSRYNARSAA